MADVLLAHPELLSTFDEPPVVDEHPKAFDCCPPSRPPRRKFKIDISRVESQSGRRRWAHSARSCSASGVPSSGRRCFSGRLPHSGRRANANHSARLEDGLAQRRHAEPESKFLLRQYTELALQVRELLEERAEGQTRVESASKAVAEHRAELWRTRAELSAERQQSEVLAAENRELAQELAAACQAAQLRAQELLVQQATSCSGFSARRAMQSGAGPVPQDNTSEAQLRRVLGDPRATTTDLRKAVKAVDALLQEAKRELSSRELRERRAAIQKLYDAIKTGEEGPLAAALELARRTEIDAVDIQKGEEKLAELRQMSPEQKAAKAARVFEEERKKQAFMLVKRDDSAGLQALLSSLDVSIRWQDWKDHAGRTLLQYSTQVRAEKVRPLLQMKSPQPQLRAPLIVYQKECRAGATAPSPLPAASDTWSCSTPVKEPAASLETTPECLERPPPLHCALERNSTKALFSHVPAPPAEVCVAPRWQSTPVCSIACETPLMSPTTSMGTSLEPSPCTSPCAPGGSRELRKKAFKAVVRDDAAGLGQVLAAVDIEVWSAWKNGAGVGLLALSEERGASNAYTTLANALGLLEELPRERFEEKDAVWVFKPGEVQPRRASVVVDADDKADDVLVEFWEGSEAAQRVDRCLLRKT